jgi:Cof subfamily protein (haloacid dehalogenase superfamily)
MKDASISGVKGPATQAGKGLRLAAIDLDGTLLGPDRTISRANFSALRLLQNNGVEIVVATGRHYDSMKPYADQIPGVKWVVSAQGAEVSDLARNQVLRSRLMPVAEQRHVMELSRELKLSALLYGPAGIFTEAASEKDIEYYEHLSGCPVRRLSFEEMLHLKAYKSVWVGTPEQVKALNGHPLLADVPMQKIQTWETLFEFMPLDVDKGSGLEVLSRHLKIPREACVAFGDAENDIPMFDWAGVSVAMPHSWPAALARARHVGPKASREDALAKAIELVLSLG